MARRTRRGAGRVLDAMLLAVCVGCAAAAALVFWGLAKTDAAYDALASEALAAPAEAAEASGQDRGGGIDWEGLSAQNPDIAGWLVVESANVSYPVVNQRPDDPDGFYLKHDFWRGWASDGCPYLHRESEADGQHVMVFAHHTFTDTMFHRLAGRYRQAEFDTLGDAVWSTPAKGDEAFVPAFSLSVDRAYGPIQRFDFADTDDLRSWLSDIADQASARADDCDSLVAGATRVLTLVTCTDFDTNYRRTLTVFVSSDPDAYVAPPAPDDAGRAGEATVPADPSE